MIGNTSESSRLINALSKIYSKLFARQSDRSMPGTAFSRGIQAGKLMAKDYRGVLLLMLAIVSSGKGQRILKKSKNFKQDSDVKDWILLIELMLEWESYLNLPRMTVYHVKRLKQKHRFIMYIMRKVARRQKGMGLKLMKFHSILHLSDEILQFGVPLEYDTSANERMHKPAKAAAKRTQRAAETFNYQTALRLIEYELLDLAMHEMETGEKPWIQKLPVEYRNRQRGISSAPLQQEICTGEAGIVVTRDDKGEMEFRMLSRSKHASKTRWNSELLEFLGDLNDKVQPYIATESVPIWTKHERNGQIFRGHPNFRGKGPWKDWVWVDWQGGHGKLPCHIWCFVVLQGMPTGANAIHHGGIVVTDGTYAVVESAVLDESIDRSDLMLPVLKDVVFDEEGVATDRRFYLADTEAFVEPCCCIPDIGGPKNWYFVVTPRHQWSELFIKWIEDPHHLDEMDDLDQEIVAEDSESTESSDD